MDKTTPLYQRHQELGGKIVPFGGYLLPVQYGTGVITEHMAVRKQAGLFDVSHMAELVLEGPDAVANINWLLTADISKMYDGQVKYAMMCNDNGGIVDDLVCCRLSAEKYLLVVNAANHEKDAEWVKAHITGNVKFTDISEDIGQIALQGPNAEKILRKLSDTIPEKYYTFIENGKINTPSGVVTALISQTGYTGEHGYEIYCPADKTVEVWNTILEAGKDEGLIPCGLGARDTLRLEASMPLYGHEMNDDISPKEAGLPCKLDGKDFLGRQAIIDRGTPKIKRVGLVITGRGIAREHSDIFDLEGNKIGWVTSGTHCPFLGKAVAMAYIPVEMYEIGKKVNIDVRGRMIEAEIIALPFYKIER